LLFQNENDEERTSLRWWRAAIDDAALGRHVPRGAGRGDRYVGLICAQTNAWGETTATWSTRRRIDGAWEMKEIAGADS